MQKIYMSYRCSKCKNEVILITDEIVSSIKNNRYIACPYCNSQKLIKTNETDDLRECMKEGSYRREHGALRQMRVK